MAIHPKIEFFRFSLKHKSGDPATFKDFVIQELNGRATQTPKVSFTKLFDHFKASLLGKHADDSRLKTKIEIVKKHNLYISKQPVPDHDNFIISGVINGGPYGRDRVVGDKKDAEAYNPLSTDKVVYLYYYIFAYCPLDHSEGVFGIHSNSAQESVTQVFRSFMTKIFSGLNFYQASVSTFAPKSFQDEFKKNSVVQSIVFEESFINSDFTGATNVENKEPAEYDIKIIATPKNGKIPASEASAIKTFFSKMSFGKAQKQKQLDDFDVAKLQVKKVGSKIKKTFEWNNKDNSFTPVIYLDEYVTTKNADGTPDFDELNSYIQKIFIDEILPEIRPDHNASKSDSIPKKA